MSLRIESGKGLEHKQGSICAGANQIQRGYLLPLGLTSKGSLSARYYHEVNKGTQSELGGTNMTAVENVGKVNHIACTGVELGHEVNSALVIILCQGIVLVAGT